jgi:mRNA interferase RelE/StbE
MSYQVLLKRSAEKELDALSAAVRKRLVGHLIRLEENPRPAGAIKLRGQASYRLRVGDYRLLYTVEDADRLVMIHAIGHRREVYR